MKVLLFFLLSIIIVSCTEKETGLEFAVMGFVRIFDEDGNEIFDRKDIKVSAIGTSKTAYTNENGKYLISGLNVSKSYNIEINKDSFGNKTYKNIHFIGEGYPGLLNTANLYKIPTYEITGIDIEKNAGSFYINGTTTATKSYSIIVFINDSNNVSNTKYDHKYNYNNLFYEVGMTYFSIFIPLFEMDYLPETTLYLAIYLYNYYETEKYYYYDPNTWSSYKPGYQIIQVKI
ncbi:MAG: carboxypeptidase-like regulatory domain-containing protein [Bacteroidales bacterium]